MDATSIAQDVKVYRKRGIDSGLKTREVVERRAQLDRLYLCLPQYTITYLPYE